MKKKDNNKIFIVCGDTGVGKSALTFQLAKVVDPDFGLKNIQFTTIEAANALKTLKNQAIIFDEAFRGMSGRNVMGKAQKELLGMLYEVRQLNQIIFLVAPSFFRLDEAIAVELSDALIHVHKTGSGRRGFRIFNRKKKDNLYYYGKKGRKSYNLVPSMFNGTFPDDYVVNGQDYRKKKFNSLHATVDVTSMSKTEAKLKDQRNKLVVFVYSQEKTYGKTEARLKEMGVPLVKSRIHEIIAQNTAIS